jgi:heme A synthase
LAAFAAAAVFGVLLFGANVTARDAGLIFPDWPLDEWLARAGAARRSRGISRTCTGRTRCSATRPRSVS